MIAVDERPPWNGPMVWTGESVGEHYDWLVQLDDDDLGEIKLAVELARNKKKKLKNLTREDFDLKHLGPRLERLRDEVLEGPGLVVIRGLPVERWSHEEVIYAYWAIGAWFGSPVPQNARADLLGHVIDQRAYSAADGTRVYQSNHGQPFHSDSCDIAGLLCIRQAKTGGTSSVASSGAIFNAIRESDIAAFDTLHGEFHCDRYGEIPAGKRPFYPIRIFNRIAGKFICCGMDPDIRSAQRLSGVTKLTAAQDHALNLFQTTAVSLALRFQLEPGDMQFVNNLTVVHAREPFEDYADPEKRRYLIRLWLSSPLGRALPVLMAERWGNIEPGTLRGGIRVPGARPRIRMNPD